MLAAPSRPGVDLETSGFRHIIDGTGGRQADLVLGWELAASVNDGAGTSPPPPPPLPPLSRPDVDLETGGLRQRRCWRCPSRPGVLTRQSRHAQ